MALSLLSLAYYCVVLYWVLYVEITEWIPLFGVQESTADIYSYAVKCDAKGKFGWACRFQCNCKGGNDCDKGTGACEHGCADGYYGTGCQYDEKFIYGNTKGRDYAGNYGTVKDGVTCLSWRDPAISKENWTFPDKSVPGPYCRNPFNIEYKVFSDWPWCYISADLNFLSCNGLQVKECPDFKYGEHCNRECHCSNVSEVCSKDTGFCYHSAKCYAGWTSIDCSMPCSHNRYGIDCMYECGNCIFDSCDPETGTCTKGCNPGFFGFNCKQKCNTGTFGIDCLGKCGQCRLGNCDPYSGLCADGCETGYQGEKCDQKCSVGYHGLKCQSRCPYCLYGGPCHHKTGICEMGCSPGFMGDSCDKECSVGTYGANCTGTCGKCLSGHPCDKYTGRCLHGCTEGYAGANCLETTVQLKQESSAGTIFGGLIGGVVVIVLIICFVAYRKRRFRKKLIVAGVHFENMLTMETTIENVKDTDLLLKDSPPRVEVDHSSKEDYNDSLYDQITHEPIYMNVNTMKLANPVKVEDLQRFVTDARTNNIIKDEHSDLPTGLLALHCAATKAENMAKNRYQDVVAYDHSRVVLTPLHHDPHSDYVNASYIDGYNRPKAYIASQGPNKAMLTDFWRMVWQEKVTKIVMLTNLVESSKKKCDQYWPSEGSHTYGEVTVEVLDAAEYTDYIIRTFKIAIVKAIGRIIKQFHFTSWTDHDAPTYPTTLLNFRRKVQQFNPDSTAPVLVHCSAGIGRSGTFIALDYLLQQAQVEGVIDLVKCAQLMRSNRVNMIQTWQQYRFVYEAVLDALLSWETTIPNSTFHVYEEMCVQKPNALSTMLQGQFDKLQKLIPTLERNECTAATKLINIQKNRFKNILPADRFRPCLSTAVDGCNDYINAVFLPSYTKREAFIVTQMPLPGTVADFWRLLYDYNSETVVMLNEFDRNDKSCALYWPEEYGYTVKYGPLSIELLFSSEADTNFTVRTFKLTHTLKGEDRAVKQFQFTGWPDHKSVPLSMSGLLRLLDAVLEWTKQNGKGPVTVHCMNGASKCGLFCACSLLFQRMRVDMEVDIYQTVKQIRINRLWFVENMEQYQYLYLMAGAYLDRQRIWIDRPCDHGANECIDIAEENQEEDGHRTLKIASI